jgi:predicted NACHT family NTPase
VVSLKHFELGSKAVAKVILKQELYFSTSFGMAEQVYQWKRFWCPRSSQINLGDRGYLTDPESEYGKYANPELVGLEALIDISCLVLLGEPGIGKSQELGNLKEYTEKNLDSGNKVLELPLRSCTNLNEYLFQDEQFIAWKDSTYRLYLFLDSLDEGLLQIQTLATQLVDTFKKSQYSKNLNRLYICIACRTAVFPNILEEGLKELWQESNVGIYELAPLRRIDVQTSVAAHGLDANTFLNEVDRKGVVPFAIKPITLRFLLNTFQKNNGQFPADQKLVDLYLDGCRSLCEEQNQSRRGSRRIGELDVTQRLMLAARIAAVTLFANRFAIWTEPDSGNVPREDVLLEELCLGDEITNERRFQVTRDVIEEVLDTGLFSSRGSGRIGWAHQTYAEFLAAWYLKQRNLELSQILNLIIHPDQRVVPQLQETAAWLASMIPEVFQEVMKTDPDILPHSDISYNDNKAKLVKSLLQAHDDNRLSYSHFHSLQYQNLDHPNLPEQLQAYICDVTKNKWARYVAIDIAETCQVKAVQSSLVDLILDPRQDYKLRVHAIRSAHDLCDAETKLRLKPLVIDQIKHDPDDDLKGYALQALYPNKYISTKEVLSNLKSPESNHFGGVYQKFLTENFATHFCPSDLLTALSWLEQQPTIRELAHPFDILSDSISQKAWEHIEDSEILSVFAKVVFLRIQKSDSIVQSSYSEFKQQVIQDDDKRRKLISEVIPLLTESSDGNLWVSLCDGEYHQLVLLKKDFLWLIKQLENSQDEDNKGIYAKLIYKEFTHWAKTDADAVSAVIEFNQRNAALRSAFLSDELSSPIELDSYRAEQAKAVYDQSQRVLTSCRQQIQQESSSKSDQKQMDTSNTGFPLKVQVNGFCSAKNSDFLKIWKFIHKEDLDPEVFESIVDCLNKNIEIRQSLTENHLAKLYIFLEREFSKMQKPDNASDGNNHLQGVVWRAVRPIDDLKFYKGHIPQWIQERGTPEACEAFRKIIHELPELADELQSRLLETEAVIRRDTWNPPRPENILQLVASQEPSNLEISNQLETIDQRMERMADEPRVDKSIHISNSKNIREINTGDGNTKSSLLDNKTGFDWKFWLSISVAVIVPLISVAASGIFNDEIKKFLFNRHISPQVEQKLEK